MDDREKRIEQILKDAKGINRLAGSCNVDPVIDEINRNNLLGEISTEEAILLIREQARKHRSDK